MSFVTFVKLEWASVTFIVNVESEILKKLTPWLSKCVTKMSFRFNLLLLSRPHPLARISILYPSKSCPFARALDLELELPHQAVEVVDKFYFIKLPLSLVYFTVSLLRYPFSL